jgi:hypothetical protein
MNSQPDMLHAALSYGRRGLRVFPLVPGRKIPLTAHGCHDGSCDLDQIGHWWQRWPGANIGVSTGKLSNLVVLDYDTKNGKPGLQTLATIRDRFGVQTLTARTPSGGIHQYFRYPGPMLSDTVNCTTGLDVRTSGGYVLIAPSIVAGCRYKWIEILPPAEMPAGLIDWLRPPELPTVAPSTPYRVPADREAIMYRVRKYLREVPPPVEGQGGQLHTYQMACRLVLGFGLTDNEALAMLSEWNMCPHSRRIKFLRRKIAAARKYGREPVGARLERRR